MDFKASSEAAQQKRDAEKKRRHEAYLKARERVLSDPMSNADDDVSPPRFELTNMVEGIWFKANQKGIAQPVYLDDYSNPSEFPEDEDEIFIQRKHKGESDETYQQMGEVFKVGRPQFPLTIPMPAAYMADEGEFDYRFHIKSWGGPESDSVEVSAILDWTAPGARDEILAPVIYPFDQATFLVDDAYIDSLTSGLEVEIPVYENAAPGDVILWAWLGRIPEEGVSLPNQEEEELIDRKVTIPKQILLDTAEVNGRCYFFYLLKDKAGNISRLSQALPVKVARGPLPGPITPPSVYLANPKLEYADIALGIHVTVGPIGDYFRVEDSIQVIWGATPLPLYPLFGGVAFPLDIRVPNDVLRKEYPEDATGDVVIPVSYQVWRGANAWPSAEINITTNFETVGGPNPGWPGPVNPDLPRLTLKPHVGDDNTIVDIANRNQEASIEFVLYDTAKEGDVIQAYWRNVRVGPQRPVASGELPGALITIPIPWQAVADGGNGQAVPVSYSIRGATHTNELRCEPTQVRVLAVEDFLIVPSLPQTETPNNPRGIINCDVAWMDHGRIHIQIPRNPQFVENETEVTGYWEGYTRVGEGEIGDPVPATNQTGTFKWSSTNNIFYVEPAQDRLYPVHGPTQGSGWGRSYYSIVHDGVTVYSVIKENIVTMGTPNGICPIPTRR